ncbi:MAG: anti-sigma factor [Saprospiraceae bacterium]|nr:anti-sigma factor [Pyrinomonadaceae bacterium]
MTEDENEIMLDLLCKKAVYGLTKEEAGLLEQFEAGDFDAGSFEETAAAIGLIDLKAEPMPDHLQAKVMADADEYFSRDSVFSKNEADTSSQRTGQVSHTKVRGSFMDWLGWGVAAAACIALAVNLYSTRNQSTAVAGNGATPTPTQQEQLDPSQQRQRLIESPGQVIRANFGKGNVKEIAEISGDVVWSEAKQAGYLRLKGLPKNDVSKETYQLWIFDEAQDEKFPIDGGTFDINSEGEVIVPIDAKLKAKNPSAFAITIEKPGGVVVSTRGKIAALAAVKSNQLGSTFNDRIFDPPIVKLSLFGAIFSFRFSSTVAPRL